MGCGQTGFRKLNAPEGLLGLNGQGQLSSNRHSNIVAVFGTRKLGEAVSAVTHNQPCWSWPEYNEVNGSAEHARRTSDPHFAALVRVGVRFGILTRRLGTFGADRPCSRPWSAAGYSRCDSSLRGPSRYRPVYIRGKPGRVVTATAPAVAGLPHPIAKSGNNRSDNNSP